jgi:hypothetical protein
MSPVSRITSLTPLCRFEMVWRETQSTYREMVLEEGWTDKKEISLPAVQGLTFKVSWLCNICETAFTSIYSETAFDLAGTFDHRKMWIRFSIYLVGNTKGSRWADVRAGGTTHRCRLLYDLASAP